VDPCAPRAAVLRIDDSGSHPRDEVRRVARRGHGLQMIGTSRVIHAMSARATILAVLVSAIGGVAVSLGISLVVFFADGSPGTSFSWWQSCPRCMGWPSAHPGQPSMVGIPWFDRLGEGCTPKESEAFRNAVIKRYLPHVERPDLAALRSYWAVRSVYYRAELLRFEFGDSRGRTNRYASGWGFPRQVLFLEGPWPAAQKFRELEAMPNMLSSGATPETDVKVRMLSDGVLPNAVLFGLPIWCVWAVWARGVPRAAAFLSVALAGALLLTVGIAWSAGSIRIGARFESYSDPASYAAAVSAIHSPPEENWDAFEGRRERSWTHETESWDFSRVTVDESGVLTRCPIRAHFWEGCGFPFIAFASDYPSPLGPAAGLEPRRIGDHVAPFDVAGLPVVWPGFVANLAFWFAVIFGLVKAPPAILGAARARRGGCRTCGHLLAGLPCCPECGAKATNSASVVGGGAKSTRGKGDQSPDDMRRRFE